jgi:hypothetical protein
MVKTLLGQSLHLRLGPDLFGCFHHASHPAILVRAHDRVEAIIRGP